MHAKTGVRQEVEGRGVVAARSRLHRGAMDAQANDSDPSWGTPTPIRRRSPRSVFRVFREA